MRDFYIEKSIQKLNEIFPNETLIVITDSEENIKNSMNYLLGNGYKRIDYVSHGDFSYPTGTSIVLRGKHRDFAIKLRLKFS